jgi:hypothetical protein
LKQHPRINTARRKCECIFEESRTFRSNQPVYKPFDLKKYLKKQQSFRKEPN